MSDTVLYSKPDVLQAFNDFFRAIRNAVFVSIPMANVIGIKETFFLKKIEDWCDYNRSERKDYYFMDDEWWTQLSGKTIAEKYACLGEERTITNLVKKLTTEGLLIKKEAKHSNGQKAANFYRINPLAIGELCLSLTDLKPVQGKDLLHTQNLPIPPTTPYTQKLPNGSEKIAERIGKNCRTLLDQEIINKDQLEEENTNSACVRDLYIPEDLETRTDHELPHSESPEKPDLPEKIKVVMGRDLSAAPQNEFQPKFDKYFTPHNMSAQRREIAASHSVIDTVFETPHQEDEFYDLTLNYYVATNGKLKTREFFVPICKSICKRVREGNTDAEDRRLLRMWWSGDLDVFKGILVVPMSDLEKRKLKTRELLAEMQAEDSSLRLPQVTGVNS